MDEKKTPLFEIHKALGAKCAPFGGWLMPIQYEGILNEHKWTRTNCSIFDIFHMGEFKVKGDFVNSDLNKVLTQDLGNMPLKSCRYGFMLNEQGGIIDDVIVYKISTEELMIVVNAATSKADFKHLSKNTDNSQLILENISQDTAKLDLQGPMSRDVLNKIVGDKILHLDYYTFDKFNVLGENIIISRTGYTGELGFELYIKSSKAGDLWNLLLKDKRVKPAGLGARDTLRLEVCYPLYGQDISQTVTPFEAGLGSFVYMDKDFIGKSAVENLSSKRISRKLCCFKTQGRRSPRHDYEIFPEGDADKKIGIVTSGSFSPSLGCGIGMGYIEKEYSQQGSKIVLKSNNALIEAEIVKKPFYLNGSLKS